MMLAFYLLVARLSTLVTCSELLSRQRRTWIIDSFTIEEGHPGPFPYVLGKIAIDRTYQTYLDLYGEGVNEEPKGVLSIDRETGVLSVHKAVDYEEKTLLKLSFEATKRDSSLDTRLGVEIFILDINDNPPRFQRDLFEISIEEEKAQGSYLLTVVAYDRDKSDTANSTFHYEIKSVSPNPPDAEFVIDEFGMISFKGCLDYEVGEAYTVLVEAKDHGEVVSLSSSTTVLIHIQDGNNHLPTISGQTGSGKVKEGESGSSPLRLHVTDRDSPNSPAWRVKYTIHDDEGGHFKIHTDPDTNDGILTVVEPLDFEEGAVRQLSVSVENEIPHFSCRVKEKPSTGLWTVDTSPGEAASGQPLSVLIQVEDVNDPPVFTVTVKEAMLEENAPIGTWVEEVTAVDPDSSHARDFVYMVEDDPGGWVTIDPQTGHITTVKIPDRESPLVVNGVYTIILHAVDNGEPPMTGTATLLIHVKDQNDNVPQLTVNHLDLCVSDDPTSTNITAFDLDDEPFGGPLRFELLGDVEEKWKLGPSYGYTVELVKEPSVYAGPHTVELQIFDMQGQFTVCNLSVTVCDCSASFTPNCRSSRAIGTQVGHGAAAIVFASLLILLFLLLLATIISCKKEFSALEIDNASGETLLKSNTEKPGTDCKLSDVLQTLPTDQEHEDLSDWRRLQQTHHSTKSTKHFTVIDVLDYNTKENFTGQFKGDSWNKGNSCNKMSLQSVIDGYHHNHQFVKDSYHHNHQSVKDSYHQNHQVQNRSTMYSLHNQSSSCVSDSTLLTLLHRRLSSLQDVGEYPPHHYRDEGDSDIFSELDSISIPDDSLNPEALQDLGPRFNQLASICQPPPHTQH